MRERIETHAHNISNHARTLASDTKEGASAEVLKNLSIEIINELNSIFQLLKNLNN